MIRFPRRGLEGAAVLPLKRGRPGPFKRIRAREMCNWIDCSVSFIDDVPEGSESSRSSADSADAPQGVRGQVCSKCKLVKVRCFYSTFSTFSLTPRVYSTVLSNVNTPTGMSIDAYVYAQAKSRSQFAPEASTRLESTTCRSFPFSHHLLVCTLLLA